LAGSLKRSEVRPFPTSIVIHLDPLDLFAGGQDEGGRVADVTPQAAFNRYSWTAFMTFSIWVR
jgi:hypothetical protein